MKITELLTENVELSPAAQWINKVYELYPTMYRDQHMIIWSDDEFAFFKLDEIKHDTVEISWIQAYPTKAGVGTKAIKILQDLAKKDNINLQVYPWDKGNVSQNKLIRFYKKHGFKPLLDKSKHMVWKHTSN